MPHIERPVAVGSTISSSRMHYFMGSGIPKHDTLEVKRLDGIDFTFEPMNQEYSSNDTLIFKTVATNKFAGHKVPTGDPERFIIIKLSIINNNSVVKVDSFRIGEHWEWYPVAKKINDNNLNPGESRSYQISAKLSQGNYIYTMQAFKYRTTEEMVAYNKLGDSYPTHIEFANRSFEFEVK